MTAACGSDAVEADLGDLSAVWQLSTTVTSNTCGLADGSTSQDRIILIQCGTQVSVILGAGLWGSGTVVGGSFDFTGTEIQTDDTGCRTTHSRGGVLRVFQGPPAML